MMDKSFIKAILDEGGQSFEIKNINGHEYHVSSSGTDLVPIPSVETLVTYSLTQLISFVKMSKNSDINMFVNPVNYDRVELWNCALNENAQRSLLAVSDFSNVFEVFPTGQQMNQEIMILELMTKMERDPVTSRLLELISSVKSEKLSTSDDDGYSQVASKKTGVTLSAETKVKNLWELCTYKTFPEVDQPIIPYVLRLHQRDEEMPKFSLTETGGGKWKVRLTEVIREFLVDQLRDCDNVTVL